MLATWWLVDRAFGPADRDKSPRERSAVTQSKPAQSKRPTPKEARSDRPGHDNQSGRDTTPQAAATSETTPFLRVFDSKGKDLGSLLALHPTAGGRQHYCIPASMLPTGSQFHTRDAEPLDFEVITWDRVGGLVLLVGPAIDPGSEQVTPLTIGEIRELTPSDPLTAISPAGRRWTNIHVQPRTVPLVASQRTPRGSVLVDADGRAVALMGRHNFLALSFLASQQRGWRGTALALTQKQIRASDPNKVIEDVQRLVDSKDTNLERVATAIQLLRESQHLARDRESAETFDRLMRWAHHQRIRLLTAVDGPKALEQALASYRQFSDHRGIHSDAVILLLQYGDPLVAMQMFQSLQIASTEHSQEIADQVARGLIASLASLRRARNSTEAVKLGAQAVLALPQRADLRMAYAQALLLAGNHSLAKTEALEALRLDPGYQDRFKRMRFRSSNRTSRNTNRTVVIPFDPQEKQIRTKGTIGTHEIQLIVDTGASYTTVPRQLAQNLGLLGKATQARVETANGPVDTLRVVLPNLSIDGQIHLQNVSAVVLDLDGNLRNSGLLGLDVLQKLNMRIDSEKSRLILRQSKARSGR